MIRSQRALIATGALAMGVVGWLLMQFSPLPHTLASPHGRIAELSAQGNCVRCHDPAGLAAGCLHCHTEIQKEIQEKEGLHPYLLQGKAVTCAGCHAEHAGEGFSLVSDRSWGAQVPAAFKHPHVPFELMGKHDRLECKACHADQLEAPFSLPGFASSIREETFVGLSQDCRSCHADIHSGGLTSSCDDCHGQEAFLPTEEFDHGEKFPLVGGHTGLYCGSCHPLPERGAAAKPFPFPFEAPRGNQCEECHEKPHHAVAIARCEDCHRADQPQWPDAIAAVTEELHRITGFRLLGAHSGVACEKCHPQAKSFEERYPDPALPAYRRTEDTCEGCHRDVHQGQFGQRHPKCLECHERDRFLPSRFGHEPHADLFPLLGAHLAVACTACHKSTDPGRPRPFSGTSHVCKDCHAYPHGEQYRKEIAEGDCTLCHSASAEVFAIRPWDHQKRTGYLLEGGHARVGCYDCHVETREGAAPAVRKYRGTSQACDACHRDVHRGQFAAGGRNVCEPCHRSFEDWRTPGFNHQTQSRFPLKGSHAQVACARCHQAVKLPDGSDVVQYKPLGVECKDCHEIIPGTNPTAAK